MHFFIFFIDIDSVELTDGVEERFEPEYLKINRCKGLFYLSKYHSIIISNIAELWDSRLNSLIDQK